jgi:hypothetical protein
VIVSGHSNEGLRVGYPEYLLKNNKPICMAPSEKAKENIFFVNNATDERIVLHFIKDERKGTGFDVTELFRPNINMQKCTKKNI